MTSISHPYAKLKIGTHNINGLKTSPQKLTNILEFATKEQINILTITDTNLSTRDGPFTIHPKFADSYKIFWNDKDKDKLKRLGLACIIGAPWNKHYVAHTTSSPYDQFPRNMDLDHVCSSF